LASVRFSLFPGLALSRRLLASSCQFVLFCTTLFCLCYLFFATPLADSGGGLMLNAKFIGFALSATKSTVLEIVSSTKTTGDCGVSLNDGDIVCYLNIPALDVDVLDAEGDAAFLVGFDLDRSLAILALHEAVDGLHGNGGSAVRALAGDGFGHCEYLCVSSGNWLECCRS
jgi:hypothetical protein